MEKYLVIMFLLLASNFSYAQKNCSLTKNKDLERKFVDAQNLMSQNKEIGIRYIKDIANSNPKYYPATLELGNYYLNCQKDAQRRFQTQKSNEYAVWAEKYLKLSYENCDVYDSAKAAFLLGEFYFINRNFNESKKYFDQFLSFSNAAGSCKPLANKRLELVDEYFRIMKNPVKYNPRALRNVCTSDDEYLPSLSHDGSVLLYTRRREKRRNEFTEELMASNLLAVDSIGELFSRGAMMPPPFNTGKLQGGACLTLDNKILYITICNYDNCDIYYSQFNNQKWQPLIKLPNTVNTDAFEGQPSVDVTGNVLYFSSNRPGGYGGYDLYKIVRKSKDSLWSAPINLGPEINTEFDEKTPFIHGDCQTLYFSSNGHGGVGGFDIFLSRLDKYNNWSKPKNLGYPLNSEGDDVAYVVSADGKRLYFSNKNISGKGGWDIFCSDIDPEIAPKQILLIKGKITDENGSPVSGVNVELTGLSTYETHKNVTENSGEYSVSTPVNKDENYMLTVKKHGFFYNTKLIDPDSSEYVPPTIEDIKLNKIATGVAMPLENVNFEFNSSNLTETSTIFLHQLAMFLEEYPQYKVELRGHTDAIGNYEDNMILSENRCRTVYNYLVMAGINANRLTYKAYGKTVPMADNKTSHGRALNRRVEFVLTDSE